MLKTRDSQISHPFRMPGVILLAAVYSAPLLAWKNSPYPPYPHYYAPPAPAYYNNPYQQGYHTNYAPPNYYAGYYYPPQPGYYAPPYPYQVATETANPTTDDQASIPLKLIELSVTPATGQKETVEQPDISLKKQSFINRLLPFIEQENTRLDGVRDRLQQITQQLDQQQSISDKSKAWLKQLAQKYQIHGNPLTLSTAREELVQKIDIIPPSLTLAQAANESAWGQSRFATEANNLFGIWTYDEDKGLIPQSRDSEKTHLIRKFDHVGESVAYYMLTLNRHPAYQKLREIRQQLRDNQQVLEGHALAQGLEKYSALGEQYIQLIQDLIRQNAWTQLDETEPAA